MERDILLLDELTGKVHKYHGVGLSKAMLCDCPLIEESYEANKLTVINQEYLEHGIWQESYCLLSSSGVQSSEEFYKEMKSKHLLDEEEYEYNCPECDAHTCLVVNYTEGEVKECSHCGYEKTDDVLERMREMHEENEDIYNEMGEM